MYVQKLLIVALLLASAGCGGENLTNVTGTVTLDGNPVSNAVVAFVPDSGSGLTCVGSTDTSGKYSIASSLGVGCPPGAYSVKIKSREVAAQDAGGGNPMEGLEPGSQAYIETYQRMMSAGPSRTAYRTGSNKDPNKIPDKYNSGAELKATIGGASQTVDFPLETGK